jgi:hypothetical protein
MIALIYYCAWTRRRLLDCSEWRWYLRWLKFTWVTQNYVCEWLVLRFGEIWSPEMQQTAYVEVGWFDTMLLLIDQIEKGSIIQRDWTPSSVSALWFESQKILNSKNSKITGQSERPKVRFRFHYTSNFTLHIRYDLLIYRNRILTSEWAKRLHCKRDPCSFVRVNASTEPIRKINTNKLQCQPWFRSGKGIAIANSLTNLNPR